MRVTTTPKKWKTATDIFNGDAASIDKIDCTANSLWANRICIASQSYEATNAPSLFAKTWVDNTKPERDTAFKCRADIPTFLQDATYYGGTVQKTKIEARIVLYNSAAEGGEIEGLYLYSGAYNDADKQALASTSTAIPIAPVSCVEVNLEGYIAPGFLDGAATSDLVGNYLFLDTDTAFTRVVPKILYVAVYLIPMNGIDDKVDEILLPQVHNSNISGEDVVDYQSRLLACNDAYGAFVPGTMTPVNQSTTSSGNLGYLINAYYVAYTYHCFLASVYNNTTNTQGSLWVPTAGKWTLCTDGNYRCYIDVALFATTISSNMTVTYYFTGFDADSTTGYALDSYSVALTQNVTKLIYKRMLVTSATAKEGIAVLPRIKRSGSNGNNYIYHNLFSCKVFPYH
jgi:hypothetical protein